MQLPTSTDVRAYTPQLQLVSALSATAIFVVALVNNRHDSMYIGCTIGAWALACLSKFYYNAILCKGTEGVFYLAPEDYLKQDTTLSLTIYTAVFIASLLLIGSIYWKFNEASGSF